MLACMAKSLAEKLASTAHLEEAIDEGDLREAVQSTVVNPEEAKPEEKEEDKPDERRNEVYPFQFEYKDDNGKVWKGGFVNHALNIGTKGRVGIAFSALNGGQPISSIPSDTLLSHRAIAHMTFSLKERPPWAKNLATLFDEEIIYALFAEVAEHERVFHGRAAAPGDGEE